MPTHPFRWGLIGPGAIAHRFAEVVQRLDDAQLVAVCSRDPARGQAFAAHWATPDAPAAHVHTDLAAMLAHEGLDGLYIATPHAQHGGAARAALQAGVAVLCEKPLVPTLTDCLALHQLAQARGVFLMEALWTRLLPAYAALRQCLQDGTIGSLQSISSRFCFEVPYAPASRLFDPALAGGALLDIGIYNIAATRWVLQAAWGDCPEPLETLVQGRLAPSGVDQAVQVRYQFAHGVVADFECALDRGDANALHIVGSAGEILLPHNFWEAQSWQLQRHGAPAQTLAAPFAINGFEYEVQEAMRCVRAGLTQSPLMPWSESAALVRWIDALRARLGVVYPFET